MTRPLTCVAQTPRILLKAVKESRLKFEKLSVLHSEWFRMLFRTNLDSRLCPAVRHALGQLKVLEMKCGWQDMLVLDGMKLWSFKQVFEPMSELESLTLHGYIANTDPWGVHLNSAFLHQLLMSPVTFASELILDEFVIDLDTLCNYMIKTNSNPRPFRSVRISDMNIYCGNSIETTDGRGPQEGPELDRVLQQVIQTKTDVGDVVVQSVEARSGWMSEDDFVEISEEDLW
jgi:hypothetical protein